MRGAWASLRAQLETAFWLVPSVIVATASAAAVLLVEVDRGTDTSRAMAFTGGPESARSVLSTIAASMLTLTGLVFSITIVVLQLTSTQFSPRVLRSFLNDRITQSTLGAFLASFAYALLVLREVRGDNADVDEFVPGLATTGAFALVAVGLVLFVRYIHHVAQSIRVVNILGRVSEETETAIRRRYPRRDERPSSPRVPEAAPTGAPTSTIASPRAGVVIAVDAERLVEVAADGGAVVVLRQGIGDFVPGGAPLADVFGGEVDDDAACSTIGLARERSTYHDPAFGFRQLVDIAERALSPGVNDPSTAVQALDQIHQLLRVLAGRSTEVGVHTDRDGVVRVVVPEPGWRAYLDLGTSEIAHWGEGSPRVQRRIDSMLVDLSTVVDGARLAAVRDLQDERASVDRSGATRRG